MELMPRPLPLAAQAAVQGIAIAAAQGQLIKVTQVARVVVLQTMVMVVVVVPQRLVSTALIHQVETEAQVCPRL